MRIFIIAALTLFVGYELGHRVPSPPPTDEHHGVTMFVLSQSMQPDVMAWRHEIGRRVPDAVVVACHGSCENGVWFLHPDRQTPFGIVKLPPIPAEFVVRHFKEKYPGRPLVLLSCNPGHCHLNIPGVYYALEDIWIVPDRSVDDRSYYDPEAVGNIFEFTHD